MFITTASLLAVVINTANYYCKETWTVDEKNDLGRVPPRVNAGIEKKSEIAGQVKNVLYP